VQQHSEQHEFIPKKIKKFFKKSIDFNIISDIIISEDRLQIKK
jgi:hypothetical protein